MKNKIFSFLLAIIAGAGTISAEIIEHIQIGDLYYNLNDSTLHAEVTYDVRTTSTTKNYYRLINANIPDTVDYNGISYKVTSINSSTFAECTSLQSVTIPISVTKIGWYAFGHCNNLTSIDIPNSVTSIGNNTFYSCDKLSSVTLPNSVTSIGKGAFANCDSLKSIIIPNSVTSISEQAFMNCTNLANVTLSNSLTKIEHETFGGCVKLDSVIIPNSVTSIENIAFSECENLSNVVIGSGVTDIKGAAFRGCKKLSKLIIPDNVVSIEQEAFSTCGLESVKIGSNIRSIGKKAFEKCSKIKTYTVRAETPPLLGENALTTGYLFEIHVPCDALETYQASWTIYSSRIQAGIYDVCTNATNGAVLVNDSICEMKSLLAIPNNEFHFFQWSDGNTNNPRTIVLTQDTTITAIFMHNPTIKYICDTIYGKIMGDTIIPTGMAESFITFEAISNYGYYFTKWSDGNTDNPRTIYLTQDTTFTAEFAVDKSGTCGADNALQWSYADDKTLTISGNGSLTENYTYGVEAPTQMLNLIIGNEVTAIGDSAFYAMTNIRHLTIGSNITAIGNYAFAECKNFDDITCYPTTVPTISTTTFANVGNKYYIYLFVPEDCQRAYKRDVYWCQFDIKPIVEATSVETDNVQVTPTDSSVIITWPTIIGASSYELVIKNQNGNIICTLIFNAQGLLTQIVFHAPSRNVTSLQKQTTGFSFEVTGLEENTSYDLTIITKDIEDNTLSEQTTSFTTTHREQGFEAFFDSSTNRPAKFIDNGNIHILMPNGKKYSIIGKQLN